MKKLFDIKSMFIGIVTGSLLFGGIVGASTLITDNVYLNKYAVTVDGKDYAPTLPLLNYGGSTYVPLKEFGNITGASVTFSNNTIVVKKPSSTNSTGNTTTTTPTTGNTTTKPTTSALANKKITLNTNSTDSFYVDLTAYGSKSANISVSTGIPYITLSKNSVTSSSTVTVTGKKSGEAIIAVNYNNGYTDYITIIVNGTEELEVGVKKTEYINIDLSKYDADKATLTIEDGSKNITLGSTKVTKSGKVKITGKKAGEAIIKVSYDSGDIIRYNVTVGKSSSSSSSDSLDIEIAKGNKFVYYVDLDEWDAKSAKISVEDDDYADTSKKSFTRSGKFTISALDEGETEIEIEFYDEDDDYLDSFFINCSVIAKKDFDLDYYYDECDDDYYYVIDEKNEDKIKIDLDDFDADWATLSILYGNDHISLKSNYVSTDTDVLVYGDNKGDAVIQITYSTGDIEYYYIEIDD